MKKVLLISNRVMHYRVSIYNYFFERFKDIGWEFMVRADELQPQNPYELRFDFAPIDFSTVKYIKEIRKLQPDCVILFLHQRDKIYWPLIHWLKIARIPIIYWNKAKNYDDPDNRVKNFLFHYLQLLSDGILLYSEQERQFIRDGNRAKVFIAPNTINHNEFPVIELSREEIKKELGIPFAKVVLSVGRMGAGGGRKRVDRLVDIFREIEMDGVGLVLVGSGMDETLAGRMNSTNTVYLGEVHDPENIQISKIFKMADLFSIPGHVGLGLNQAFFWGLPVITMLGDQPPEIHYLVDGRNGFLIPENDVSSLKEKIELLLNDDTLRLKMSECARADFHENASIDRMFDGFRDCIRFVAEK